MRWCLAALSLLCCLMPWRLAAHSLSDAALRAALDGRMSGDVVQRLCYNPRHFVSEAKGQILGYGSDTKISLAQVEVAIDAELARLRAGEMRWLLEADLDSDMVISAAERDVRVGAANVHMQARLFALYQSADADGDTSVSFLELKDYAAQSARARLTPEAQASIRAVMAFDLDEDGWTALSEVSRAVDLLCGAVS